MNATEIKTKRVKFSESDLADLEWLADFGYRAGRSMLNGTAVEIVSVETGEYIDTAYHVQFRCPRCGSQEREWLLCEMNSQFFCETCEAFVADEDEIAYPVFRVRK